MWDFHDIILGAYKRQAQKICRSCMTTGMQPIRRYRSPTNGHTDVHLNRSALLYMTSTERAFSKLRSA